MQPDTERTRTRPKKPDMPLYVPRALREAAVSKTSTLMATGCERELNYCPSGKDLIKGHEARTSPKAGRGLLHREQRTTSRDCTNIFHQSHLNPKMLQRERQLHKPKSHLQLPSSGFLSQTLLPNFESSLECSTALSTISLESMANLQIQPDFTNVDCNGEQKHVFPSAGQETYRTEMSKQASVFLPDQVGMNEENVLQCVSERLSDQTEVSEDSTLTSKHPSKCHLGPTGVSGNDMLENSGREAKSSREVHKDCSSKCSGERISDEADRSNSILGHTSNTHSTHECIDSCSQTEINDSSMLEYAPKRALDETCPKEVSVTEEEGRNVPAEAEVTKYDTLKHKEESERRAYCHAAEYMSDQNMNNVSSCVGENMSIQTATSNPAVNAVKKLSGCSGVAAGHNCLDELCGRLDSLSSCMLREGELGQVCGNEKGVGSSPHTCQCRPSEATMTGGGAIFGLGDQNSDGKHDPEARCSAKEAASCLQECKQEMIHLSSLGDPESTLDQAEAPLGGTSVEDPAQKNVDTRLQNPSGDGAEGEAKTTVSSGWEEPSGTSVGPATLNEDGSVANESWDSLFNDDGDCLDPRLLEGVSTACGPPPEQRIIRHSHRNYMHVGM